MGNSVVYSPAPATDVFCENGKHGDIVYASATIQGWRRKQEDFSKIVLNFHDDLNYFAVFDGHGGSEIAEFLKNQLHNYIKGFLEEGDDIEVCLHSGFLSCDASLRDPAVKAVLDGLIEKEDTASRILKSHLLDAWGPDSGEFCDEAGTSLETIRRKLGGLTRGYSGLGPSGEGPTGDNKLNKDVSKPPGPSSDGLVDSTGKPDENDGAAPGPSSAAPGPSGAAPGPSGAAPGPSGSAFKPGGSTSGSRGSGFGLYDDGPGPSREAPLPRPGPEDSESLQYLLNEDLESSDSEDDDFDIEDEESLSETSDEDMQIEAEALLKQEPGDLSGSTATIVLLGQSKIYVANIGDTKCVLSRNSQAVDMTLDHSPHNPEELLRIKEAGGSVSADGRVNNLINLSRAFGDFHLKGASNIPADQLITAEPYIKSIDIQEDDDFLVIASDGIWNSFSSQGLIDYINLRIKAKDSTLNTICEEVFKFVMPSKLSADGTGCDNMTLLIIKFQARDSSFLIDENQEMMEYQSLSSESDTDIEAAQEQPSSSTEVDLNLNLSVPPTTSGSTSDEVHSTSTLNQPISHKVPVINKDGQREIEVVELDP